jgi:uncharacterized protein (TIGR02301 family)
MTLRPATLVLAALIAAGPAGAQTAAPPFEADLLRFSEILGAVAYLDALCGEADAATWRQQMQKLITAQRMTPEDRRRYVDAYNRGHRTFAAVHRQCTDQTRFVMQTYLAEGATITARLDERFGQGPRGSGSEASEPRLPGN